MGARVGVAIDGRCGAASPIDGLGGAGVCFATGGMAGRSIPGVAKDGRVPASDATEGPGDVPDGRTGGNIGRAGGIAGIGGMVGR